MEKFRSLKPFAFILITYNRPDDMLELARNIAGLDEAATLVEEIIIINNASSSSYKPVLEFIDGSTLAFQYFDSKENLGVAKGRNLAISKSKAPFLIFLDDDAVLQNKNALTNLIKAFDRKNEFRPVGLISFKVLYYDTLQMQKNALPHKHYNEYRDKNNFDTYYYAGGAHAIRKEVLNKAGLYPEDFFYGMEEYDLSYRILESNFSIVYDSSIVMLHKESPLGRKPKEEKIRMMWVNKTKVAWRYLPRRYVYTTAFMWSLFYLKTTGINLKGLVKGYREIASIANKEKRTPLHPSTLTYLRSVHARLWY